MKMLKKVLPLAIAAAIATPAMAEVSANIGVTSNYMWRGVTQSGDEAAVSGGVDYSSDIGFFAGTWTSNVSAGNETDLYVGYGFALGELELSATYNYYMYSQEEDLNFGEVLLDADWKFLSFGVSYTTNSDVEEPAAFNEGDLHAYVGVSFDLGNDFGVGATYGSYMFDADGSEAGDLDYDYVKVDLTKAAGDFGDFTLSVSKLLEDETGVSDEDDEIIFVSWKKSF